MGDDENKHLGWMPKCVFCNKPIPPWTMDAHIRIHISEKHFFCNLCPMEFSRLGYLKMHGECHISDRPFRCSKCPKTYKRKAELTHHMKERHLQIKPFKCELCPMCFTKPSVKAKHLRTHTGERLFRCKKCDKTFALKHILKNHLTKVHSRNCPRFVCVICGKQLTSKSSQINHTATHNTSRRRECRCLFCGKCFFSEPELRQHVKIHTNEKPFTCSVCNLAFRKRPSMESHRIRVHCRLPGPNTCLFCSRRFHTNYSLIIHYRNHLGEKPYICSRCGVEYTNMSSLKLHKNIKAVTNPSKPALPGKCRRTQWTRKLNKAPSQKMHPEEAHF